MEIRLLKERVDSLERSWRLENARLNIFFICLDTRFGGTPDVASVIIDCIGHTRGEP